MALSKMHENKEQENVLNEDESKSFVPFKTLVELRNKIYEEWEEKYETTPLNKFKNPQLRIENIKALLLSFYICFPSSRNEALNLDIVDSEKQARTKEAAIHIKIKIIFGFFIMISKKNIHQLNLI